MDALVADDTSCQGQLEGAGARPEGEPALGPVTVAHDQQLRREHPAGRRRELGTGKNRLLVNEQHPRRHRHPDGQ